MKKRVEYPDCHKCFWKHSSIFCDLPKDDTELLNTSKGFSVYKKGQVIFNEGSYPHGVYCIYEGKVKLSKLGDYGKEQIIQLSKSGELIGYRALLSGDKYFLSATTMEDSTVCLISREIFFQLIEKNPKLAINVIKVLAKELKELKNNLTYLAQKPVRERVAEALLHIKEIYGFEKDNATVNLRLTREDLANFVGTATETTIRVLSEFKGEKLIAGGWKRIKILNVPGLKKIANVA
ncbi:MAG: Crp/Fnr family transcriptional regulator [Bacteroidetes bacterium]|nr:Crp/Fnr family transcriptional regulator [Bacteroidota bacterium]